LRFFAFGSTKIPLLTELKMMNAIPADDFTHDGFLSHKLEGQLGSTTASVAEIGVPPSIFSARLLPLRLERGEGWGEVSKSPSVAGGRDARVARCWETY
jgi:hypothetical protein